MPSKKLIDYIKENVERGVSKKSIKDALLEAGWQGNQIEEAFSFLENQKVQEPETPSPTKESEEPKKKTEAEKEKKIEDDKDIENLSSKSDPSDDDKNKVLLIILIIALFIVVSASSFAFFNFVLSEEDPEPAEREEMDDAYYEFDEEESQRRIMQGIENMEDVDLMEIDFFANVENIDNEDGFSFFVKITPDLSDAVRLDFRSDFEFIEIDQFSFLGTLMSVDQSFYLNLSDFSESLLIDFPSEWAELAGSGYVLLSDDLNEEVMSESKRISAELVLNFFGRNNQENLSERNFWMTLFEMFDEGWEDESIIITEVQDGNLNGVDVRRKVIDMEDLDEMVLNFVQESSEKYREFLNEQGEEVENKIKQSLREAGEQDYYLEIWMDGDDIARVEMKGGLEAGDDFFQLLIGFNFYDLDEDFTIQAPEEYVRMEDILNSSNEEITPLNHDNQLRSDLSQIEFMANEYYHENETYEGFENSDNWISIKNEIPQCSEDLLGADGYQIRIADQDFSAWALLCDLTEENERNIYYCVDSQGDVGIRAGFNPFGGNLCEEMFEYKP